MEEQTDLICAGQDKTVLMYAIEGKLEPMCDKLIEMGADINAQDSWVPPLSSIMRGSATFSIDEEWGFAEQARLDLCGRGQARSTVHQDGRERGRRERRICEFHLLSLYSRTSAAHSILT